MQLEVKAPAEWLDSFSLYLRDQLTKRGYVIGPRVGTFDTGTVTVFVKDDVIICVQILEEEERTGDAIFRLESETDIAGIDEIWDDAVIGLGREFLARIRAMARNSNRVEQALKA